MKGAEIDSRCGGGGAIEGAEEQPQAPPDPTNQLMPLSLQIPRPPLLRWAYYVSGAVGIYSEGEREDHLLQVATPGVLDERATRLNEFGKSHREERSMAVAGLQTDDGRWKARPPWAPHITGGLLLAMVRR